MHRGRSHGEEFLALGVLLIVSFVCTQRFQERHVQGVAFICDVDPQTVFPTGRDGQFVQVVGAVLSGVRHASCSPRIKNGFWHPLTGLQGRLLRELGATQIEALENYKLAPLSTRCEIGILGFLPLISLEQAPAQLVDLFPRAPPVQPRFGPETRIQQTVRRQSTVLRAACPHRRSQEKFTRLCRFVILLPQEVVDISFVSGFQSRLQRVIVRVAKEGAEDWHDVYSGGVICRQVVFHGLLHWMLVFSTWFGDCVCLVVGQNTIGHGRVSLF